MSGASPEEIERDLARASEHLRVAASELADADHGDAAAFVGTLALLDGGADLHAVGAHLWAALAGMDPQERTLALGAVFDVARSMYVGGGPAEEPAVVELTGFLEQVGSVYPREFRRAVET